MQVTIKRKQKVIRGSNNQRLDQTPLAILGPTGGHFGFCRRCGIAGGERVPPLPLGWYSNNKEWLWGEQLPFSQISYHFNLSFFYPFYLCWLWEKVLLDKKRIVWINPNNGFSIAALQELEFKIGLPDCLPTFQENLNSFKKLWTSLDHNIELLYENIENHHTNQEYCSLDCHFPFATVCSELYSKFEPDPP